MSNDDPFGMNDSYLFVVSTVAPVRGTTARESGCACVRIDAHLQTSRQDRASQVQRSRARSGRTSRARQDASRRDRALRQRPARLRLVSTIQPATRVRSPLPGARTARVEGRSAAPLSRAEQVEQQLSLAGVRALFLADRLGTWRKAFAPIVLYDQAISLQCTIHASKAPTSTPLFRGGF